MKKSTSYKISALTPFFSVLANSCSDGKTNIFMGSTPAQDTLLLKDAKTGTERILVVDYANKTIDTENLKNALPYFHIGDTVYLHCSNKPQGKNWYDNLVFNTNNYWLGFDEDSIRIRKSQSTQQPIVEKVKQAINQKQK